MPLWLALAASVLGELLLWILAILQSPWLAIAGIVLMLLWMPFAVRERG